MDENKRCNLEKTENGVRVCWGNHDKALGCEWEYFVSEGYSRRPELDEDKLKLFLYSQHADRDISKGVDFKVALQSQHLAKAICAKFTAPEAKPASSVNAELRSALEECIRVMIDNDEYGWSDDAIKQAEQALNSIKAGKDTK